jgi:putative holliday junction resolvase
MPIISALGLDVGKKRIGIAGCDGTGLIATGLTTLIRSTFLETAEQIRGIVVDRRVQILVVGLPYNMDGSIGHQAKYTQRFAQALSETLQIPVDYIDERLTSVEAEQILQAARISPSRNKALIDQQAAALILQQWLDARHQPPRA